MFVSKSSNMCYVVAAAGRMGQPPNIYSVERISSVQNNHSRTQQHVIQHDAHQQPEHTHQHKNIYSIHASFYYLLRVLGDDNYRLSRKPLSLQKPYLLFV